MSTTVTGNDNWVDNLTVPQDGDTMDAVDVAGPIEDLGDRTTFLRNRVPGAAASYNIAIPAAAYFYNSGSYFSDFLYAQQTDVTGAGEIRLSIPSLPVGSVIKSVTAYLIVSTGRAGLPATVPKVGLKYMVLTSSGTSGSETSDTSADLAAYETNHTIVHNANETVEAGKVYYVIFGGETGANSQTGLRVSGFVLEIEDS